MYPRLNKNMARSPDISSQLYTFEATNKVRDVAKPNVNENGSQFW